MRSFRPPTFTREGISLLVFGLILVPAVFGGIILDLMTRQDDIANNARSELAAGMVESVLRAQANLLLHYAVSDQMYEKAVLAQDQAWFDVTAGRLSGINSRLNASLVIDENMRPVLGSWYQRDWLWDPEMLFPDHFRPLFQEAVMHRDRGYAAGYMSLRGALVAVAIGRIQKVGERTDLARAVPPRYLVFAHILDMGSIVDLRETMSWPDMTLSTLSHNGPEHEVRASDGHLVGYVGWTRPRLALDALHMRLPVLVAGLSITSIASLGLYLRMRRVYQKLQGAELVARNLAHRDHLTGLPNLRALHCEMDEMLRKGMEIHLLQLDFDGFKEVNDRLGHRLSDLLLIEMSKRMRKNLPKTAILAHYADDEFSIVLRGSRQEAMELAYDMIMAISSPYEAPGQIISMSASIGVAGSEPGMSADELLRRADLAQRSARLEHPGLARQYDEALDARRRQQRATADDIRDGLPRGEFHVAYQPIISARDHRAVGVEALARWNHPHRGAVSPCEFIPIAEQSRLVLRLGEFILRTACQTLAESGEGLYLSANLSPVQMLDDRIVETIAAILEETGFPARRLELEVTEGYLIEQEERAVDVLTRLRALGIRISLDDFGSGYASIGYLRKLPLDKVKIDRSLILPIETNPKAREVVAAVVALCRSLDLGITAEGVETEGQVAILSEIGCDRFQGYLFGRPVSTLPVRGAGTDLPDRAAAS